MSETKVAIKRPSSSNTPPNCAICLGNCTNNCFSDSCMHQFCFKCLLEWSRIKAECPLCKQPFKRIIHNVKSNEEYDEHVVEVPRNEDVRLIGNEDVWFLPLPLTPHRHEFHVRTTFTVDSRGEHAIQQMLLAHPFTSSGRMTINTGVPSARSMFPSRHRRDYTATGFRRSIYAQGLWVNALPDLTGRYRECSPLFFRENPMARQRLVPWLNRELNALLFENTQLIMHLVDLILDHLMRHHICSRTFRDMLQDYLDINTNQFVHEFYNFMRSPFDMVGYDRNVTYTARPDSPAPLLDDTVEIPDISDGDSDVMIVGETTPAQPVTIDLLDSNSDSDEPIIVSSSNQIPLPLAPRRSPTPEPVRSPNQTPVASLPPKLRFKHLCVDEFEKLRNMKRKNYHRGRSTSCSSTSSCNERSKRRGSSYRRRYRKKKSSRKHKQKRVVFDSNSNTSTEVNVTTESDSEDDKPIFELIKGLKEKSKRAKRDRRRKTSYREPVVNNREGPNFDDSTQMYPIDLSTPSSSRLPSSSSASSSSRYHIELPKTRVEVSNNGQYTSLHITSDEPSTSKTKIKIVRNGHASPQHSRERGLEGSEDSNSSTEPYRIPNVKSEIREVKWENPGPSTSKPLPLVLKREHNKWYVFADSDSSD